MSSKMWCLFGVIVLFQACCVSPEDLSAVNEFEDLKKTLFGKLSERMSSPFSQTSFEAGLEKLFDMKMEVTDDDFEEIEQMNLGSAKEEEYKGILSLMKEDNSPMDREIGVMKFCLFGLANLGEHLIEDFLDHFQMHVIAPEEKTPEQITPEELTPY